MSASNFFAWDPVLSFYIQNSGSKSKKSLLSYKHFKLSTPYRRTPFANVFILDHSHMQKHTHTCTHFATILKFFLTVYVFF